jgi:hypothetical protein
LYSRPTIKTAIAKPAHHPIVISNKGMPGYLPACYITLENSYIIHRLDADDAFVFKGAKGLKTKKKKLLRGVGLLRG